jgi:hypothetical protein
MKRWRSEVKVRMFPETYQLYQEILQHERDRLAAEQARRGTTKRVATLPSIVYLHQMMEREAERIGLVEQEMPRDL